jgi:beta-lactamase class D
MRPMSTFKVINSLIALETGVIDTTEELDWDDGPASRDDLKTPMNLSKALSSSAILFFQILARIIGVYRYRRYLSQCGYDNSECGGAIDSFCLNGSLLEQLGFVSKFADSELPFAKLVLSAVQQILVLEGPTEGVLRGKTGYADSNNEHLGWFIGYLSAVDESLRVVTLLNMSDASQLAERREIAEECLRLGAIEK